METVFLNVETGFKPVSANIKNTLSPKKGCVLYFVHMSHLYKNTYRVPTVRLQNYDYSSNGLYFITICTQNREHSFGEIIDNKLIKTVPAEICKQCWIDLPAHYPNCFLDAFIIMPDHIHGIIGIDNARLKETGFNPKRETGFKPVSTKGYSLFEIVRGFKTFTAKKINISQNTIGKPFWQSRFYDRIIRSEKELENVREYILYNAYK